MDNIYIERQSRTRAIKRTTRTRKTREGETVDREKINTQYTLYPFIHKGWLAGPSYFAPFPSLPPFFFISECTNKTTTRATTIIWGIFQTKRRVFLLRRVKFCVFECYFCENGPVLLRERCVAAKRRSICT